eukprot:m.190401 g.190401  ORF g.190401 m.190401 type:complete len:1075 (+) comp16757_c0_seq2:160-3384(+)
MSTVEAEQRRKKMEKKQVTFPLDISLLAATTAGDADELASLLHKGADPNAGNHDGLRPLHQAAIDNRPDLILLLIHAGADVNALDNEAWTPLHGAASNGHIEACRVLLQHGADLTKLNNDLETPLDCVENAPIEDNERARLLSVLNKAAADKGISASRIAEIKNLERQELLQHVQSIVRNSSGDPERELNIQGERGATMLHFATCHGYNEVVEYLLNNGADVNVEDDAGMTPLHAAVIWGNVDAVLALVSAGADIAAKTHLGETLLELVHEDDTKMKTLVMSLSSKAKSLRASFRKKPDLQRNPAPEQASPKGSASRSPSPKAIVSPPSSGRDTPLTARAEAQLRKLSKEVQEVLTSDTGPTPKRTSVTRSQRQDKTGLSTHDKWQERQHLSKVAPDKVASPLMARKHDITHSLRRTDIPKNDASAHQLAKSLAVSQSRESESGPPEQNMSPQIDGNTSSDVALDASSSMHQAKEDNLSQPHTRDRKDRVSQSLPLGNLNKTLDSEDGKTASGVGPVLEVNVDSTAQLAQAEELALAATKGDKAETTGALEQADSPTSQAQKQPAPTGSDNTQELKSTDALSNVNSHPETPAEHGFSKASDLNHSLGSFSSALSQVTMPATHDLSRKEADDAQKQVGPAHSSRNALHQPLSPFQDTCRLSPEQDQRNWSSGARAATVSRGSHVTALVASFSRSSGLSMAPNDPVIIGPSKTKSLAAESVTRQEPQPKVISSAQREDAKDLSTRHVEKSQPATSAESKLDVQSLILENEKTTQRLRAATEELQQLRAAFDEYKAVVFDREQRLELIFASTKALLSKELVAADNTRSSLTTWTSSFETVTRLHDQELKEVEALKRQLAHTIMENHELRGRLTELSATVATQTNTEADDTIDDDSERGDESQQPARREATRGHEQATIVRRNEPDTKTTPRKRGSPKRDKSPSNVRSRANRTTALTSGSPSPTPSTPPPPSAQKQMAGKRTSPSSTAAGHRKAAKSPTPSSKATSTTSRRAQTEIAAQTNATRLATPTTATISSSAMTNATVGSASITPRVRGPLVAKRSHKHLQSTLLLNQRSTRH